jgi:AraC family transcriptional regulator
MMLKKLPDRDGFSGNNAAPSYGDHYLYTADVSHPYHLNEHYTGLGLLAILKGAGNFRINGTTATLDENSFLVINRGSRVSITISRMHTVPVLIFFNSALSEIVSNSVLFRDPESDARNPNDFSLIEHIHYTHATLKDHLRLLIDLGTSCASFHALKADMVLRTILDDLIYENYSAIQASSNLAVVKKSTRVELYKRLSMAKDWMEQNFTSPITLNQAADISMLNSAHFLRLFKQAFRLTPHQYLINLRVKKAQDLLLQTDQTVSTICHHVGFESLSSFSGLFKQRFGASPAQFRKQSASET